MLEDAAGIRKQFHNLMPELNTLDPKIEEVSPKKQADFCAESGTFRA